ncbi:MAG: VCBS repeat-containing protein, partial [Methanobacteriota archaeon]
KILNNSIISNKAGIRLRRSSPMISGNRPIEGNQYGLYLEESSSTITGNVLRNNIHGLYSVNSSDLAIEDNVITNAQGRDLVVGNEDGNVIQYYREDDFAYSRIGSLRTTDQAKIDVGFSAYPSSVDLDGDGRQDLIVGNEQGYFRYYRNTGDGYEDMGLLTHRTPLEPLNVGSYAHPFVTDWDSDGELDLLVGRGDGNISYFVNDGNDVFIDNGTLVLDTLGLMASPYFEDWFLPPNPDLVLGSADGYLRFLIGANPRTFIFFDFMRDQIGRIHVPTNSSPLLAYWNNDTMLDLLVGDGEGNLTYYEAEDFTRFYNGVPILANGSAISISKNAVPALGDWNKDGISDIILGGDDGLIFYYKNAGDNTFREPKTLKDSGGDIDVGSWSAPFAVHWNDDDILDLVVGDAEGNLTLFLGNETGSVTLSDGQQLQTQGPPTYITTSGWSAPAFVDWNNDGDSDLIAGGNNGTISYYENDGTNEFIFQWNLSIVLGPELDVGFGSAPSLVDWNSNGTLDLLVGDRNGYVHRFERVSGDLRDVIEWGKLSADGSQILVGERAVPNPSDLDEDGDLDLLVGDDSGLVHRYERESGELYYRGYLKSNGQNLTVDGYLAPLMLGWESSSTDADMMNGAHFENSTAQIVNNDVIRGGGGGYGICANYSSIVIENNGWIAGGKGRSGIGFDNKSASGGQGIVAWGSSILLSRTNVQGGDGSDTQFLEGGDGGVGIEVKGGELEILNSTIGGGAGRMGIATRGVDGMGISIRDTDGVFIDSSSIRGRTTFQISNASMYLRNSRVLSIERSFDLGNASTTVSMNTSFDKSSVLFRDPLSTLTVGWHLDILALDGLSNPVPKTSLRIWPATFTSMGELSLSPAISGEASPIIANLSLPNSVDLLVGNSLGNVQHYIWNAGQFVYNGTLNKSSGGPASVVGSGSPFLVDWNEDGKLDLFLGAENGSISFFNNSGNGEFNDSYLLRLDDGTSINLINDAVPRITDWNQDGDLDLIAGGNGYIKYYENNGSGYFLPGIKLNADGLELKHGSWSSPLLTDIDLDGLMDLLIGTSDGLALLYLNASNEFRLGGHLKTNNSILHDIDVGNRSIIATMDVDGDGYQDLLIGNSDGNILWFRSNRYAGNITSFTELDGHAVGIPVVEYEQRDLNGDNDGEDEGERTYLSPSGVVASRCGEVGNAAPLPYLEEYLSITIQVDIDMTVCPPIVHSAFPYHGETDVPVSSDIIITFDKNMETSSVEDSLFYTPQLTDTPTWRSNSEVELDVGTMQFDTEYTVTILGNTANDTFGRGL